jgi:hypothetical protein
MRFATPSSGSGVGYMIAAAFFFSIMSLIVKALGTGMPTAEVVFARSVVMLVLAFVMIRRAGIHLWCRRKSLLVLRARNCPLVARRLARYLIPLHRITLQSMLHPGRATC